MRGSGHNELMRIVLSVMVSAERFLRGGREDNTELASAMLTGGDGTIQGYRTRLRGCLTLCYEPQVSGCADGV